MKKLLDRFSRDEGGASAIEYTLIASLLAVALLTAWPGFYNGFMTSWTNAGTVIANAVK